MGHLQGGHPRPVRWLVPGPRHGAAGPCCPADPRWVPGSAEPQGVGLLPALPTPSEPFTVLLALRLRIGCSPPCPASPPSRRHAAAAPPPNTHTHTQPPKLAELPLLTRATLQALAFVINGGAIRLDRGHPFLRLLEQDWLHYGDLYSKSPRCSPAPSASMSLSRSPSPTVDPCLDRR